MSAGKICSTCGRGTLNRKKLKGSVREGAYYFERVGGGSEKRSHVPKTIRSSRAEGEIDTKSESETQTWHGIGQIGKRMREGKTGGSRKFAEAVEGRGRRPGANPRKKDESRWRMTRHRKLFHKGAASEEGERPSR